MIVYLVMSIIRSLFECKSIEDGTCFIEQCTFFLPSKIEVLDLVFKPSHCFGTKVVDIFHPQMLAFQLLLPQNKEFSLIEGLFS